MNSVRHGVLGATFLVLASTLTGHAAAAMPGWAIQATPNPTGPMGSLSAVACPSATSCIAVGAQTNKSGVQVPLAEDWTGGGWTIQPAVIPSGATYSVFSSVACVSTTMCIAVGSYLDVAGNQAALAERWNGSTWSIQPTPAGGAGLNGVTCVSSSFCVAVGFSLNSGFQNVTLAEQWNGAAWAIVSTPIPSGSQDSDLVGIACAAATTCTAVGSYYDNSFAQHTLAEGWNTGGWTIQSSPTMANNNGLAAVACSSTTACTAVGYFVDSSLKGVTLAERWNGITWSVQSTPNPTGGLSSGLSGVACPSPATCTAVGQSRGAAVVEAWDGSNWSIQPSPKPNARSLSGVACPSTAECSAVGYSTNNLFEATLAEAWNGSSWTIQPTPPPHSAQPLNLLASVACMSTTQCIAVGGYGNNSAVESDTIAESWDGTSWALQHSRNATSATASSLAGVSCSTSSTCMAVGGYMHLPTGERTLAENWNGSVWAIQATPTPSGADYSNLSGVACASSTLCVAVGAAGPPGTILTLAEAWNGSSWAVQTTPNPPSATNSSLSAVACPSTTQCTAVGQSNGVALAEAWSGTSWVIQSVPTPSGAQNGALSGVACASTTMCTAVGSYRDSSNVQVTLIESWNGLSWAIQPSPTLAGAQSSSLSAVACASTSACTAVGSYTNSSGVPVTLAESWNGSAWTNQPTPNPSGAQRSSLAAVACVTATICTVVGDYTNGYRQLTLAERHS